VLLGGILTQELNWSWIFFINVPIGAAVLLAAPRYIRESRVEAAERAFDIGGAILATSGLSLLVYALVQTTDHAWGSARTIGLFLAAVALLVGFVATEARAKHPLMPLHIFRNRSLSSANAVALMLGASVFSMFFLLTLYMQQVLGYSPLKTGVGYLTVATTIVISAGASQAFVTRIGVRSVLAFGMALTSIGLIYFTQVSVNGSYLGDLVPGFLLTGAGLGFSFVPVSIAALVGVKYDEAGIASGILNTSQQVGGALGTAILSTVAFTATANYIKSHGAPTLSVQLHGAVSGFSEAFAVGAGIAALGVVLTLAFIPRKAVEQATATEPAVEPISG
jgi:MFS family permease